VKSAAGDIDVSGRRIKKSTCRIIRDDPVSPPASLGEANFAATPGNPALAGQEWFANGQ
jgi:hypothetical protein